MAFEQRKHTPRYAHGQRYFQSRHPENYSARPFEEGGDRYPHAALGDRTKLAGSSKCSWRTSIQSAFASARAGQEHHRGSRSRGQALHLFAATGASSAASTGVATKTANAQDARTAILGRCPQAAAIIETAAAHHHRSLDQRKAENAGPDQGQQPRRRTNDLLQPHISRRTSFLHIRNSARLQTKNALRIFRIWFSLGGIREFPSLRCHCRQWEFQLLDELNRTELNRTELNRTELQHLAEVNCGARF